MNEWLSDASQTVCLCLHDRDCDLIGRVADRAALRCNECGGRFTLPPSAIPAMTQIWRDR